MRARQVADLGQLLHQRVVDAKAAGGVEDQDVEALAARGVERPAGDLQRLLPGHDLQARDLGLPRQHLELGLRRRPRRVAVLGGMGLLALHSAHYSKIFRRLLGTSCSLRWRNEGERELVWTVDPTHPVAAGVPHPIVIEAQEMYGEHFDIPAPDELVFVSSFAGGEVFRGGCGFHRGAGRIFYFSPGDQDYPVYHHPDVRRVLANAVLWAAPAGERRAAPPGAPNVARGWFEGGG